MLLIVLPGNDCYAAHGGSISRADNRHVRGMKQ